MSFDADYDEEKEYKKRSFNSFVWSAIFCAMAIFVPNKETLMQIMIARYATYDNASTIIQAVQNAADHIIEMAGKAK